MARQPEPHAGVVLAIVLLLGSTTWKHATDDGNRLRHLGHYEAAEKEYRTALAEASRPGGETPELATSLNNLAVLYHDLGQDARAEPLHRRALAMRERLLGTSHVEVAASLNNLAEVYRNQGRLRQAETLCRRAAAIWEARLGPEHPAVAVSRNNLASVQRARGEYGSAEALLERALAIWEKSPGRESPEVAGALNNLAELQELQGRTAEVERLYQRALAIWRNTLGDGHANVALVWNNLGKFYTSRDRPVEAEQAYRKALHVLETAPAPAVLAATLANYSVLLRRTKRGKQAARLEARAREVREDLARQGLAAFTVDYRELTRAEPRP